ncbi:Calcium channel YVC1 [Erysiphe necator]|nr:Calcium channel YVC1 [Erysiphe necator]
MVFWRINLCNLNTLFVVTGFARGLINYKMATIWERLLGLTKLKRDQRYESETLSSVLPTHQGTSLGITAAQVTKTALRLRYLIEECIPYEIDVKKITVPHSRIITKDLIRAVHEAGGIKFRGCVVYCLLVNNRWFKKQARLELCDADLHNVRAIACEVIAKNIIETEEDQDYLFKEVLLKRYFVLIDGKKSALANVIERAVDLHTLRVIGSSGYQKCVNYLWRGWLVQDEKDPSEFVSYKKKANISYWAHVDPDRMRAPVYQNATQVFFSIVYLGLYTGVINTVNRSGDLDIVEIILHIFTFGFLSDELSKIWKVGYWYIGFWNVFNLFLYTLLTTSLTLRLIALGHPVGKDHLREKFNELSYNFLAFSAPMFWMRLLLYLDSIRFFGTMLIVLKVMMSESLIFFALLTVIIVGFLQAFIGLDAADSHTDSTYFILRTMTNAVMLSPEFSGFDNFAPPFGAILYYIFTFLITTVLLNILIALFNSAYQDITDNAIDEYLALFSQKTMQFVRAPDENVFIAPLNLVEIFLLILPFEWWLPRQIYARLNEMVLTVLYLPLLLVAAWFETCSANKVTANRSRGEDDDDTLQEWEQLMAENDFNTDGWDKRVQCVKTNIEEDQTNVEILKLIHEVEELKSLLKLNLEKIA